MHPRFAIFTASVLTVFALTQSPAFSRTSTSTVTNYCGDRVCPQGAAEQAARPVISQRRDRRISTYRVARGIEQYQSGHDRKTHGRASNGEIAFLPHPPCCPQRQFCACGAAYKVFGRCVRELWPVSAWYGFPRALPAPGMIAIPHRHHLFVLESQVSGDNWWTADYNSGGHQSRRQVQNIAGMTIVNPHGERGHPIRFSHRDKRDSRS